MNLTVRFFDNAATFSIGSTSLQPAFHRRLDDLIPEVIAYATADTLWPLISEIRIEGHTSSEWNHDVSERDAYVLNMELSQGRTRSVLNYFLQHPVVRNHPRHTEIQRRLTANGLSSSHPILDSLGREDSARSRRVEIRFQEKRDQETIDYMRRKYAATR